jgi:hypothetical protein
VILAIEVLDRGRLNRSQTDDTGAVDEYVDAPEILADSHR